MKTWLNDLWGFVEQLFDEDFIRVWLLDDF